MKRGILYQNKKHQPAAVAVAMAKREYEVASHTQGFPAKEVYFNPDEAPEEAVISGLTVYTDRSIKPGHIRVTTNVVEYAEAI